MRELCIEWRHAPLTDDARPDESSPLVHVLRSIAGLLDRERICVTVTSVILPPERLREGDHVLLNGVSLGYLLAAVASRPPRDEDGRVVPRALSSKAGIALMIPGELICEAARIALDF
jgi:hypothetical protein